MGDCVERFSLTSGGVTGGHDRPDIGESSKGSVHTLFDKRKINSTHSKHTCICASTRRISPGEQRKFIFKTHIRKLIYKYCIMLKG